ncbi:MAG: SDR family NAD(P)-dependent oxidoreductase [Rhodospirillales bacterium]|jgi:NAD(P)-dependent dehydrogenase (short-subunit alcohol dehydrogenase family)|nr:SDR family NAD(P)-dependent oxidoreductase [Rhodospirillales bacterium]MDP6883132.1 SDR family NAD(P)-dependent oxidoreductase [Rhodospirillales bacterium]
MTGQRLAGKSAIVTGAGNGIGRAVSEAFAAEGAKVLCADIAFADAEEVVRRIGEAGGQAVACHCDVSDGASAKAAVDRAVDTFGALDVVVSNAAVFVPITPLAEMAEDDWHRTLAVNLTGSFLMCKHAIPRMQAGGGSIILVASQMARVANAGQTAYCATKGALVQLAKGMALEYVGDNIRVNALSPGGVATDRMVRRFGDLEKAEREWGAKHPMGRLGRVEEIAAGAVFLASDESSFMTGSDLLIDGGYAAW